MTTTTELTEVGQSVVANGIRTNYLEAGSGEDVVLIHGSGTRCDVLRELAAGHPQARRGLPRGRAGHGRLRLLRPPGGHQVRAGHLGRPDRRGDGRARHREGQPGRQQLRRVDRAAHRHQAPGPDQQAGADGQHGRAFRDHPGPGQGVGLRRHLRGHAQGAGLLRLLPGAGQRRSGQGPVRGQQPARLPGVVLVDVPGSAAALGRRDVDPRRGHQGAAAPHADRARPGGQGHPAVDLAAS